MIARYQRNRIASAILEVTLSAQLTITHQRNPFFVPNPADGDDGPDGGGAEPGGSGGGLAVNCKTCTQASNQNNPASSVIQLVGSAILFHCPYYFVILWNSVLPFVATGWRTPATLLNLASFLLLLSPTINAILYGVRSKIVRRSFRNIWRKQKQKIEIHYEIQARTPSTRSGSAATADARSEIGTDPDGPSDCLSPLSRVKFGSCSALTGGSPSPVTLFACNPLAAVPAALEHGRRPKITITKILPDEEPPEGMAHAPPSPSSPRSPLSPLSPFAPWSPPADGTTEHHHHHHPHHHQTHQHQCGLRSPTVDGATIATNTTVPPNHHDNLSVAGQSGAMLHPAPPSRPARPALSRRYCLGSLPRCRKF
ncbi:AGAP000854-PA-like protein [Anopheles sinensis]|uniref:AGAP000854-PA-like protein n=1 Tax=Anopheles sinensis TaxID=74873 RepID=A0A084WFE0_ANOSI|nr:AGAP000854-PA-like protein [Anopheles sinensis]